MEGTDPDITAFGVFECLNTVRGDDSWKGQFFDEVDHPVDTLAHRKDPFFSKMMSFKCSKEDLRYRTFAWALPLW